MVLVNTPQIPDVVKTRAANRRYVRAEGEKLGKYYSKSPSRFAELFSTPKSSIEITKRNLLHCRSILIRRIQFYLGSVLPYSASINGQSPNTIVNRSMCSRAAWCAGHMQLAMISAELVRESVSRAHATKWSGMEGKKKTEDLEMILGGLQNGDQLCRTGSSLAYIHSTMHPSSPD